MDQNSIRQFPDRSTLQRIRILRESLIDLSVALDDVRAHSLARALAWPIDELDLDLLDEEARLAALLDEARRELAALLGRAA
jgi:hypothetical protein